MPTVLKFENISKQYRLGLVSTRTLSHDLNRWYQMNIRGKDDPYLKIGETNDRAHRGQSDYVWALKDISFDVEQGDVLGIIGKNGAGKSTLLKILSKVTSPTTGTIRARGRIASLLEVGTGFHPEMTGRENIFMNGAIMGMTKSEIRSKLDEIVDFSGVERYLDTPVKRYSSGMTVRLGFAIAAHLDPEILVVDEVLAVGDAEFQKKAIGKMQDVSKGEGRTVLFVSHNMESMRSLCNKGILLNNGLVSFKGNIKSTILNYQKGVSNKTVWKGLDGDSNVVQIVSSSIKSVGCEEVFLSSSDLIVSLSIRLVEKISSLVIGFNIYSVFGHPIARTDYNDKSKVKTLNPGSYILTFVIPSYTLSTGEYRIYFDVAKPYIKNYATELSSLSFDILPDNSFGNIFASTNSILHNSIIREDWFDNIESV
jgi:lipopolysaccharide transport system ATP-binding protein